MTKYPSYMLDGYHLLTITHREAPLEWIGLAAVPSSEASERTRILNRLKTEFGWEELYYAATCNRVVLLFYTTAPQPSHLPLRYLSALRHDLSDNQTEFLSARMRLLRGSDAVRHFVAVAASMDSLVVGEREIIRQMREAFEENRAAGLTGDHLRLLMRFTVETAKEIYAQTAIGEKALSVAALAFHSMCDKGISPTDRILLIGAGRTNALFAKFLVKYGYQNIVVFNRSLEKAEALAEECGALKAFSLEDLPFYADGFDALVVCTAAREPVVNAPIYERILRGDTRKKTIVDLSVPQNVSADMPERFSLNYIGVESLRTAAEENLAHRRKECEKAELIIDRRLIEFRAQWHERQIERALAHIPEEVRAVKERALNDVYGKALSQLDDETRSLVQEMMSYMEKKCVAIPMKAAKAIALHASRPAL